MAIGMQVGRGYATACFEIMLPLGERNGQSINTDIWAAYLDAWTAFDVDSFLTGPSVLDEQAAEAFKAVMAQPPALGVDLPLSLEAL
jgi:hypothetical protein